MRDLDHISRFISFALRGNPDVLRLKMDSNEWVNINELIENANSYKYRRLSKMINRESIYSWNIRSL